MRVLEAQVESKNMEFVLSNIISNLEFIDENNKEFSLTNYICYLLKAAENCDAPLRAEIENNIVKLGIKAVPHLANSLLTVKGAARGLAAMAIIRMGFSAVEILKQEAEKNADFNWIAKCIINEISGCHKPVGVYAEAAETVSIAV